MLYYIRKSDKLAVSKMVAKFSKQTPLKSPFAYCLLVCFKEGHFPLLSVIVLY